MRKLVHELAWNYTMVFYVGYEHSLLKARLSLHKSGGCWDNDNYILS